MPCRPLGHRELVAAGHRGRLEPYDAFFGARYAMVDDPDGHAIGLMSPIDAARKFTPAAADRQTP